MRLSRWAGSGLVAPWLPVGRGLQPAQASSRETARAAGDSDLLILIFLYQARVIAPWYLALDYYQYPTRNF
jgi:hypothetical protein